MSGAAAVKLPAKPPICTTFSLFYSFLCVNLTADLQEIDAAGARRRGDPDKTETGGGLMADMRGHNTADELGSSKLPIWYHTWITTEKKKRD